MYRNTIGFNLRGYYFKLSELDRKLNNVHCPHGTQWRSLFAIYKDQIPWIYNQLSKRKWFPLKDHSIKIHLSETVQTISQIKVLDLWADQVQPPSGFQSLPSCLGWHSYNPRHINATTQRAPQWECGSAHTRKRKWQQEKMGNVVCRVYNYSSSSEIPLNFKP